MMPTKIIGKAKVSGGAKALAVVEYMMALNRLTRLADEIERGMHGYLPGGVLGDIAKDIRTVLEHKVP
jgi:hypothetical protein